MRGESALWDFGGGGGKTETYQTKKTTFSFNFRVKNGHLPALKRSFLFRSHDVRSVSLKGGFYKKLFFYLRLYAFHSSKNRLLLVGAQNMSPLLRNDMYVKVLISMYLESNSCLFSQRVMTLL